MKDAYEVLVWMVTQFTNISVDQFGVDGVIKHGGVAFVWQCIEATCPPHAAEMLVAMRVQKPQLDKVIAGILGLT